MSIVSQIDVFFQSFHRSTIILQQFLLQFNFIRFNLKSMTLNQSMSSCLQASKKRVGYFFPSKLGHYMQVTICPWDSCHLFTGHKKTIRLQSLWWKFCTFVEARKVSIPKVLELHWEPRYEKGKKISYK